MEINVVTAEQSFSYLFIHSNSISSLYKNYVSRGRPTLQMTTSNSTTFHDGLSTRVTQAMTAQLRPNGSGYGNCKYELWE